MLQNAQIVIFNTQMQESFSVSPPRREPTKCVFVHDNLTNDIEGVFVHHNI